MAENQNLEKQLSELAEFLVKARRETVNMEYQNNRLEYQNGVLYYRAKHHGTHNTFDTEEVRQGKNGKTIWRAASIGYAEKEIDAELARNAIKFIRRALGNATLDLAFLGPKSYPEKEAGWLCQTEIKEGDITRFVGEREVRNNYKGQFVKIFSQYCIGGIIT